MFVALKTDDAVPFGPAEVETLARAGVELAQLPSATEAELIEHGRGVDALMVVDAPVSASVIESLERCRVIGRFGSGLDNVDVEAATRRGIRVTHVPAGSVDEVSDHALAMLLALGRRLFALDAVVRGGGWELPAEPLRASRLRGQTLGVIGVGRIGGELARKAAAVGLRTVGCDPYVSDERLAAAGIAPLPLDDLLSSSDHVSIHTPLTAETHHLIGARELSLMRSSATLINVSRGAVVDQAALAAALAAGRLAGAGLDVLEPEPPPPDEVLLSLPNVILSPHAAHHSRESLEDLRRSVIDDVIAVLSGGEPLHPANLVAER